MPVNFLVPLNAGSNIAGAKNLDLSGNLTVQGSTNVKGLLNIQGVDSTNNNLTVPLSTTTSYVSKDSAGNLTTKPVLTVGGDTKFTGRMEGIINSTLNGVTTSSDATTIVGSRKIAESPFHLPKPQGPYAVDLHNVTTWCQFESTVMCKKSQQMDSVFADSSGKIYNFGSIHTVSEYFTPTDNIYTVPTKYGTKYVDIDDGDVLFYKGANSANSYFLTFPMPFFMDVYIPVVRDTNTSYPFFNTTETVNNYYDLGRGGNPEMIFSQPDWFMDDIASDSVFALLRNYDMVNNVVFSSFTDDVEGTIKTSESSELTTGITTIRNVRVTVDNLLSNRMKYLTAVFAIIQNKYANNLSKPKVLALKNAIMATNGYKRVLSFRTYINRYNTTTDDNIIIKTAISTSLANIPKEANNKYDNYIYESTLKELPKYRNINDSSGSLISTNVKLPIYLCPACSPTIAAEVASQGILVVSWLHDYAETLHFPVVPRSTGTWGNKLGEWSTSAQLLNYKAKNDKLASYLVSLENGTGTNYLFNDINRQMTTAGSTSNKYCTGSTVINYGDNTLSTLRSLLNSVGLTDNYIDKNTTIMSGFSWYSYYTGCVHYNNKTLGGFNFIATVCLDGINGFGITSNALQKPFFNLYPEGFVVPMMWFDLEHPYNTVSVGDTVGYVDLIQNAFTSSSPSINIYSYYVQTGNVHTNYQNEDFYNIYNSIENLRLPIRADGIDYPNDAYNNVIFNSGSISVESFDVLYYLRIAIAISLFCKGQLFYLSKYDKDMILQILPGKKTLCPYFIDCANTNKKLLLYDTLSLCSNIVTYDYSSYNLKSSTPTFTNINIDLKNIKYINNSYKINNSFTNDAIKSIEYSVKNLSVNTAPLNKYLTGPSTKTFTPTTEGFSSLTESFWGTNVKIPTNSFDPANISLSKSVMESNLIDYTYNGETIKIWNGYKNPGVRFYYCPFFVSNGNPYDNVTSTAYQNYTTSTDWEDSTNNIKFFNAVHLYWAAGWPLWKSKGTGDDDYNINGYDGIQKDINGTMKDTSYLYRKTDTQWQVVNLDSLIDTANSDITAYNSTAPDDEKVSQITKPSDMNITGDWWCAGKPNKYTYNPTNSETTNIYGGDYLGVDVANMMYLGFTISSEYIGRVTVSFDYFASHEMLGENGTTYNSTSGSWSADGLFVNYGSNLTAYGKLSSVATNQEKSDDLTYNLLAESSYSRVSRASFVDRGLHLISNNNKYQGDQGAISPNKFGTYSFTANPGDRVVLGYYKDGDGSSRFDTVFIRNIKIDGQKNIITDLAPDNFTIPTISLTGIFQTLESNPSYNFFNTFDVSFNTLTFDAAQGGISTQVTKRISDNTNITNHSWTIETTNSGAKWFVSDSSGNATSEKQIATLKIKIPLETPNNSVLNFDFKTSMDISGGSYFEVYNSTSAKSIYKTNDKTMKIFNNNLYTVPYITVNASDIIELRYYKNTTILVGEDRVYVNNIKINGLYYRYDTDNTPATYVQNALEKGLLYNNGASVTTPPTITKTLLDNIAVNNFTGNNKIVDFMTKLPNNFNWKLVSLNITCGLNLFKEGVFNIKVNTEPLGVPGLSTSQYNLI